VLINAAPLIGLVKTFRIVHFSGRYGSGKTALAYRIAYELLESGFSRYLLSNCNDVWREDPADVVLREGRFLDCCVILDEAGLFMENSRQAKQFVAFMRKMNVVLLLPSVDPPPGRVRFLQVQRQFNLMALGLPLWLYTARLNTGMAREKYGFGWWRPVEIFGVYDTGDFVSDDEKIGEFLAGHVERLTGGRYGKQHRREAEPVSKLATVGGDAGDFLEAAAQISDAVSVLGDWGHQRSRRR
jgi:hypothetical protein